MKKLLILMALFTLSIAHADTVYTDPSKSILIEKNTPQFTIKLTSNQATGYSWLIENYDRNLLRLVKHVYHAPEKSSIGAEGYETWIFLVKADGFVAPQVTKVKLLYARPWNLTDNNKLVEFVVVTH